MFTSVEKPVKVTTCPEVRQNNHKRYCLFYASPACATPSKHEKIGRVSAMHIVIFSFCFFLMFTQMFCMYIKQRTHDWRTRLFAVVNKKHYDVYRTKIQRSISNRSFTFTQYSNNSNTHLYIIMQCCVLLMDLYLLFTSRNRNKCEHGGHVMKRHY